MRIILHVQFGMQCSAYLLVRFHPSIRVPGTAVHRRGLLSDEVCHLNPSSRIPAHTTRTHSSDHCGLPTGGATE